MVERREGTSTEGRGLGHSFGADNVARGEDGANFIKRRPTYPWGDNPRAREIQYYNPSATESFGPNRHVYRSYRDKAPLEGQSYSEPKLRGKLMKIKDLRPALPDRSVKHDALDAAKLLERAELSSSDFMVLFPRVVIEEPSAGATFTPGSQITIKARATVLRYLTSATLFVGNRAVDRRTIDRRDQEVTKEHIFIFIYDVPSDQHLGPLELTVRAFNFATAFQGFISDDSNNRPPQGDDFNLGKSSANNEFKHQATSALKYSQQLESTGMLRTPEGVSSITVNIV